MGEHGGGDNLMAAVSHHRGRLLLLLLLLNRGGKWGTTTPTTHPSPVGKRGRGGGFIVHLHKCLRGNSSIHEEFSGCG